MDYNHDVTDSLAVYVEAEMIHNIEPHIYHNKFAPVKPEADDIVFCFEGQDIFLQPDHTVSHVRDLKGTSSFYWLFRIDDTQFFLLDRPEENMIRESMRILRSFEPRHIGFAGITAWQIYVWRNDNRYCGRCGKPMIDDDQERAMRCPACGNVIYPRINPAVIVGVINDHNQLLVTKYAHSLYNRYALVAGYTEIGETIEETVIREVKEETGIDVTDLKYYKCQPWSFSSSLLFGFWCRAKGSTEITIDENELKTARWMDMSEEINSADNTSLTGEMIRMFKEGKAFL